MGMTYRPIGPPNHCGRSESEGSHGRNNTDSCTRASSTSVIDSACGYAALTLMPPSEAVLCVEFKVNLLAPARGARFHAHGRVERAGRR